MYLCLSLRVRWRPRLRLVADAVIPDVWRYNGGENIGENWGGEEGNIERGCHNNTIIIPLS